MKQVILSPGHGKNTPGKRSPDESLFEWEFNRKLVSKISEGLLKEGIPHILLDMGTTDVTLQGRVARANTFGKNCLYVSVHGNAAGNGSKWMKARGFSAYTSKGLTASDAICEVFMRKAGEILPEVGASVRKWSQKKWGWEENFYVLKHTIMPAVLTENLFYDNLEDCEIMKSERGLEALARVHVEAIKEIMKEGL